MEKLREPKTKGCVIKNNANGEDIKNSVPSFKYIFKEGVEIMGDECSPVGWILSPSGARNNY